MADPTPYVVSYSFSGWQANEPDKPLPAAPMDNEFANVATAPLTPPASQTWRATVVKGGM